MKFSMTGQAKCDLLIQVTACAGLTVIIYVPFNSGDRSSFNDSSDSRVPTGTRN